MPYLPAANMLKCEVVTMLDILQEHYHVFEWGSGQSTILFSQWCERYVSIEHKLDWFGAVKEKLVTSNVDFRWRPSDAEYVNAIDDGGKYDVVFIDGKFRVECARKAATVIEPRTRVLIHDFDRPAYQAVLDIYHCCWVVGTLGILELL